MTIRGYDLEQAIVLRDRLKALDTFLDGFDSWGGLVSLSFGSYEVDIAAEGPQHRDIRKLLTLERELVLSRLNDLDVAP